MHIYFLLPSSRNNLKRPLNSDSDVGIYISPTKLVFIILFMIPDLLDISFAPKTPIILGIKYGWGPIRAVFVLIETKTSNPTVL